MLTKDLFALAKQAGFQVCEPNSMESWAPFIGAGDTHEMVDVTKQLNEFAKLLEAVELKLHLELAAARLDATTAWQRYEMANRLAKSYMDERAEWVAADIEDGSCPACGHDGGTSCGDPNCGLLQA